MPNIEQVQRVWENLAIQDPFWAILADPKKNHRQWDIPEFFATGESEISTLMRYVNEKSWSLDFSGISARCTRSLSGRRWLMIG